MAEQQGSNLPVRPESPPPSYTVDVNDQPPPAYDQNASEPPPSYDSLYGRVRQAKQESDSHVGFFKKFLIIILGTIGCTIILALTLAIPISMIVIGVLFKDDCPAERFIPIYLIVAGVFGAIKSLSSLVQKQMNSSNENEDDNARTNPFDGILSCFLFIWFIAGNVWIYGIYGDSQYDNPSLINYCQPTLYWFAFWITTATYILMACGCCCVICAGIASICFG